MLENGEMGVFERYFCFGEGRNRMSLPYCIFLIVLYQPVFLIPAAIPLMVNNAPLSNSPLL